MRRTGRVQLAFTAILGAILINTAGLAQCPVDVLLADDGAASDFFGQAVAVSGDTAVVGATWGSGSSSSDGAAYVYVRSGDSWIQQAKLIADDAPGAPSNFGRAVAIEDDVIVVGASTSSVPGTGAAYVFERTGTEWARTAKLTPHPDVANGGADFGNAVAIDGNTIVVGAWLDQKIDGVVTILVTGAAYVFVNTPGSAWADTESSIKLSGSDLESQDHFGIDVDIDGDRIVIGANDNGDDTGAVYVFDKAGGWAATDEENARLAADDEEAGDEFGGSVAVSGDTVIVGARYWDDASNDNAGAAYVFFKSAGVWSQQERLASSNTNISAFDFGTNVSLDGETAVVTEPFVNHLASGLVLRGSAQIFTRTGTTWTFAHDLLPVGDNLFTVPDAIKAIGFDGSTLILGSPDHDWTALSAGAAFIFEGMDEDCNENGVPDACDIADETSLDENSDGVPDECAGACAADLTADGTVNVLDLIVMLGAWGTNPGHAADLNGDDLVNVLDLIEMLGAWGVCA